MNALDKKVLVNKLAIAANYIDAKVSGNVKTFYKDIMEYTDQECKKVIPQAIAVYKELKGIYTDQEISQAALDTCLHNVKKVTTKPRTKAQGIKAAYQSDKEYSYISITITKPSDINNDLLVKICDIMISEDWGYYCGEILENECANFFGSSDKTIKDMQDDYKEALKIVLN